MEKNKIDDSYILENVIFENNYGSYNKNYIHLKRKNKILKLNQIAFLEIIEININTKRIKLKISFIVTSLMLIVILLNLLPKYLSIPTLTTSFLYYIFLQLKKNNKYLKIIYCNPRIFYIKLEKNEVNEAISFVKSFSIYRQLNPEL